MRYVAIIEDDRSTNDTLKTLLLSIPDVQVLQAFSREEADALIATQFLDLAIVDVELGTGLKDRHAGIKLLSDLSAKGRITLVVSGIPEHNLRSVSVTLNAYDFIAKPISDVDFVNKVERALALKAETDATNRNAEEPRWPEHLELDTSRAVGVLWKKQKVALTMTELRLVHSLADAHGEVVVYATLARYLTSARSSGAVKTHMTGVRQKFLDVDPEFESIKSEPGKGYVWKSEK